ncbi:MAG: M23 family metallopeptidase [Deltaproteobacteria bacterium]|nr:M23 family metallopeptidase [Deltaproteobacteria bacterium]
MTVTAYRDHGGNTDWNCGSNTYSGHRGTDYGTYGGWAAVDEGRAVVAAAEGTVVEAHDGEFDRCTTGGCGGGGGWGNYVAVQHADGVITYYAHQRTGSIAVAVGDWVTCGQHLGFIASSGSSTGPHLHFEPRSGGTGFEPYGFGGCSDPVSRWIDQGPYEGLPGTVCPVTDRLPEGWIDAAACDGIRGWARDPDDAAPIDVHVYIDGAAGDPAAAGYAIRAAIVRDDVGEHGFSLAVPHGFMDGRDHAVFAYGIGAAGGANGLLSGSPATLRCDPPSPPFPDGVRRHVPDPATFDAWRFDGHDIVHVDDTALSRFPESDPWPAMPSLVSAGDADPDISGAVYVRDVRGGVPGRRHVPSPEAMDRWRLDWGAIETVDRATIGALELGAAISTRPYLVQGSGPAVYVVDAPPPARDAGSPPGSDAGSMGGDAAGPGNPGRTDGGATTPGRDAGSGGGGDSGIDRMGGVRPVTGSGCSAVGTLKASRESAVLGWVVTWVVGLVGLGRALARARRAHANGRGRGA